MKNLNSKQIIAVLLEIGLSEKEAKVYFAALVLGPTSILKISKESAIKRSTVYSIIESLQRKLLIKKEVFGVRELYVAAPPSDLENLLLQKRKKFQKIVPQLNSLYKLEGAESIIKYYEGVEATRGVYLDLIKTVKPGSDYLIMCDYDKWYEVLGVDFAINFPKARGKLKINVKMMAHETKLTQKRFTSLKEGNEEFRFLPESVKLTTNLVLTPQKAFIHQLSEPIMGMVIENKHIINTHKEMYYLIWHSL